MVTALDVLAQNNFGDTRTGGLTGPLGLLIIVLMGIATVLLIRNMNARLRRLPDRFPRQDEDPSGTAERIDADGHQPGRNGAGPDKPAGTARDGG